MINVDEICDKYDVSKSQLKTAVDELCRTGIAKGCFDTNSLLAVLEILSSAECQRTK